MYAFSTEGWRARPRAIILCFPSVCSVSSRSLVTPSSTHVVQSNHSLLPFRPSFQLVHPAQVWLRKRCVSLPCKPAQSVFFLCVLRRVEECVLSCTVIWNDVMFSYFFASFLLDSSMCSAAALCYSSLMLWFLSVFSSYLCLFVCVWYLNRAAELSGVKSVKSLFFFTFLFMLLGFFDSLCARFQNWTFSPVTHFSWQSLSLKVYLWAIHHEGQGHKRSSCTPQKCENKCVPCWYFAPFQPILEPFKVHFCCFYGPCPALPSTTIILIQMSSSYISFTPFSYTNPSLSQVIQVIQVICKPLMEPNPSGTLSGDPAK